MYLVEHLVSLVVFGFSFWLHIQSTESLKQYTRKMQWIFIISILFYFYLKSFGKIKKQIVCYQFLKIQYLVSSFYYYLLFITAIRLKVALFLDGGDSRIYSALAEHEHRTDFYLQKGFLL